MHIPFVSPKAKSIYLAIGVCLQLPFIIGVCLPFIVKHFYLHSVTERVQKRRNIFFAFIFSDTFSAGTFSDSYSGVFSVGTFLRHIQVLTAYHAHYVFFRLVWVIFTLRVSFKDRLNKLVTHI
jgi:hypothetical protein